MGGGHVQKGQPNMTKAYIKPVRHFFVALSSRPLRRTLHDERSLFTTFTTLYYYDYTITNT
jgi:hypothetical protein